MRLDRFITLNVVQRWRRTLGRSDGDRLPGAQARIPILMYHSISEDAEDGVAGYYQVNTTPAAFRAQMALLANAGYHSLTVSDWIHSRSTGPKPARKTVLITFDDGLQNFYTEAFPVLRQFGLTATMFLPTGFIADSRRPFEPAGTGAARPGVPRPATKACMTWAEVKHCHAAGIEFGSHTVSHPKLVTLPFPQVQAELRESKAAIEHQLQTGISAFCYPYAFPQANANFVSSFTEALAQTGYTSCCTTELGQVDANTAPFRLKRLPVNSLDDVALLSAKLEGNYNWLGWPQNLVKRAKALVKN